MCVYVIELIIIATIIIVPSNLTVSKEVIANRLLLTWTVSCYSYFCLMLSTIGIHVV